MRSPGAADGGNAEATSGDTGLPKYLQLTRRRIYYNRLIGDATRPSGNTTTATASLKTVFRFVVYLALATVFSLQRNSVSNQNETTEMVRHVLKSTPWSGGAGGNQQSKYFNDISSVSDVLRWIAVTVLIPSQGEGDNVPLSILNYNRIVPQKPVCPSWASLTLTLRKAKVMNRRDSEDKNSRFDSFFPNAWQTERVRATDKARKSKEGTQVIESTRKVRVPSVMVDTSNPMTSTRAKWAFTFPDCNMKNSIGCGFDNKGGYVALFTWKNADVFLHLINDSAGSPPAAQADVQAKALGICNNSVHVGNPSNVVKWDDILTSGLFSSNDATLTLEFMLYNANMQILTHVTASFFMDASGSMEHKTLRIEPWNVLGSGTQIGQLRNLLPAVYLLFTLWLLVELLPQIWRNSKMALKDIWVYITVVSSICSLCSTILPSVVSESNKKTLRTSPEFQLFTKLTAHFVTERIFDVLFAFALLFIWIRFLQVLMEFEGRVRLLMRAMAFSFRNMMIYVAYIAVIFFGFAMLAQTLFSANSWHFTDLSKTLVSCYELFLGKTDSITTVEEYVVMTPFFFIPFMVFFNLVSVQMFNAIINYAYNFVSEDMADLFKTERENKRRKNQARDDQQQNPLEWFVKVVHRITRGKNGVNESGGSKSDGDGDKGAAGSQAKQPNSVRDKPEPYLQKNKHQKPAESFLRKFLFLLFLILYFIFVDSNLQVTVIASINDALHRKLASTDMGFDTTGELHFEDVGSARFEEVKSIRQLSLWMTRVLPNVLFSEKTAASIQSDSMMPRDSICLNSWNCFVTAKQIASGDPKMTYGPKIIRLTKRRFKRFVNNGMYTSSDSNETTCASDDSSALAFSGGCDANKSQLTWTLMKERRTNNMLDPSARPDTTIENSSSWNLSLSNSDEDFCTTVAAGEGGFKNKGGVVCFLDASLPQLQSQLAKLSQSGFYDQFMSSLTIEFVLYNGNTNVLMYTVLTFVVLPTGLTKPTLTFKPISLLDFDDFLDRYPSILSRIIPGVLYMGLVGFFALALLKDLRQDWYRRKINENKLRPATTIDFFMLDIFNMLDLTSIVISIVSFFIFIISLYQESNLSKFLYGDFSMMLDRSDDISRFTESYRTSFSVNMIIILIRVLKFFRTDPRMSKLNQTIFDARQDLFWFVVVFFITYFACVFFAFLLFGKGVKALSSIPDSAIYCWYVVVGNFDFWSLHDVDPIVGTIFFLFYSVMFYCVFTNIFFAIIDRNFVSADPPTANPKRMLKPIFGKICSFIDWDEDDVMEVDEGSEKNAPKSRRMRVQEVYQKIKAIKDNSSEGPSGDVGGPRSVKSKQLVEVCDPDERLGDVVHWSKEEAKKFVQIFKQLERTKQEPQHIKNEDNFVRNEAMTLINAEAAEEEKTMKEAERHKRYQILINEEMVLRDQETLAKYISLLEIKLHTRLTEKHSLKLEVAHLHTEFHSMRYSEEQINEQKSGTSNLVQAGEQVDVLVDGQDEHAVMIRDEINDGVSHQSQSSSSSSDGSETERDKTNSIGHQRQKNRDPTAVNEYTPAEAGRVQNTQAMTDQLGRFMAD
eukprot:TRINITY_DN61172_c0_g1_i1.p1 TRINITY_DN61172_c0_g1~~TRINITY_DN61172_c0_g1_i1.p1  ORF type:complete len:1563 (-),score=233.61 TRINITY_DN61172_c0_g1_i1:178-4866(-)